MSIIRWLAEQLNPCFHEWQVLETLKDNETDTREVTIVRQCTVCSKLETVSVKAPARTGCPPHNWVTDKEIRIIVMRDKKDIEPGPNGNIWLKGFDYYQTCSKCGDKRHKRVHEGEPS